MTLPSIEKIVSNYLYGQDSPPTDFVDGSFATARPNIAVDVSLSEYLDPVSGPGRFALGSEFPLVQLFSMMRGTNTSVVCSMT